MLHTWKDIEGIEHPFCSQCRKPIDDIEIGSAVAEWYTCATCAATEPDIAPTPRLAAFR